MGALPLLLNVACNGEEVSRLRRDSFAAVNSLLEDDQAKLDVRHPPPFSIGFGLFGYS